MRDIKKNWIMEDPIEVYNRLVSNAIRLNTQKLINYTELIQQMVGEEWLISETIKAKKGGLKFENLHRLIYLLGCYNTWIDETIKTKTANATLEIIELMKLGSDLEAVKRADNYKRVIPRLKLKEQYDSTVFEIEVAVAYLNIGCKVSFLKESQTDKLPDLEVETAKGFKFYVECKAKILKPIVNWGSLEKYVNKQLREGNKQFTLEGPGILWFKFPYAGGLRNARDIAKKLEQYVISRFKPDEKRKITKVDLLIPTFQKIKDASREGLAYHPARVIVNHPNPLYKLS